MLIHLLFGIVISAIGTLPLGMINLTVAESTISKGLKAGLWIALGATLVELIQVFIAVKFSYIFSKQPMIEEWMQILAIPIFLGLGFYFLFRKGDASEVKASEKQLPDFFKGMAVSSLNLLAIPYWIFYGSYLNMEGYLQEDVDLLGLILGAFIGTMLILFLYARMSLMVVNKMDKVARVTNYLLAALLILFGLIQLLRVAVF